MEWVGGVKWWERGEDLITCKDQILILKYTLVTKYIYTRYMCVDSIIIIMLHYTCHYKHMGCCYNL